MCFATLGCGLRARGRDAPPGPGRLALSKRRPHSCLVHHDGWARRPCTRVKGQKAARPRRVASKRVVGRWCHQHQATLPSRPLLLARLLVPVDPARILVRTTTPARPDPTRRTQQREASARHALRSRRTRARASRLADEQHRPFRRLMGRPCIACVSRPCKHVFNLN